jgi:cyclophilin family peptidyl-prolyl cis-trans isomerase
MRILAGLALLLSLSAAPQQPVLHDARVVLRTSKGDLLLALYPQVAPRHVFHFLRLVRSGYYDGTRFAFIRKGFVMQHAGDVERLHTFTPEQSALRDVKLPAEFSKLRHARGVLSMARRPDNFDSASSVFAIMLGDAPHMDGKYTIFGRVEKGFEVLDQLEAADVRPDGVPKLPVNLHRAFVEGEGEAATPTDFAPPKELLIVAGSAIVLGLAAFLLAGRFLPRTAGPIGLTVVIAGFFIGFVAATPRIIEAKENRPILALAAFLALLTLFKLMNRFESPPR